MKRLRRRAFSLTEALITLCVAGCVLPVTLDAFGTVILAIHHIGTNADRAFGAEWWFNRLKLPVSHAGISVMPETDSTGKLRFEWKAEEEKYGSIRITLYVRVGSLSGVPFVLSRVY